MKDWTYQLNNNNKNIYEYTHLIYNWVFDKASVLAHLRETFRVSASPAFLINCFSPPAWYASQSVFYNDRPLRVWMFLCQMSSTVSQVLLNSFSSAASPPVEYGQWPSIFSGMAFSLKHVVDRNSCSTKLSWRPQPGLEWGNPPLESRKMLLRWNLQDT